MMVDKLTVRAIYEDGVFKPLEPVGLPNKQVVEFEVRVEPQQSINDFEGILAPYWNIIDPADDDIDKMLKAEHQASLDRLLNQIEGQFEEDDRSDD